QPRLGERADDRGADRAAALRPRLRGGAGLRLVAAAGTAPRPAAAAGLAGGDFRRDSRVDIDRVGAGYGRADAAGRRTRAVGAHPARAMGRRRGRLGPVAIARLPALPRP